MNQATYSPEDNKLRLYVGRVPRDEYEKLRAEGWKALHKQREAGGGDFVATWTPSRRDTALEYAGIIEDEDQGPAERAADRAERFGGYLDKRLTEAAGHADRYDSGPTAHGFQSQARADRSAARHDRVAVRSLDAWSKAEYWQQRTAGVISHALYKSTPGVRMGRIKILEAELRRFEASPEHYPNWIPHTKLRLAYENQMLEAQGGRAAFVEMVAGGWLGKHQIRKVNKSNVTGRVVSVTLKMLGNRWGNEAKPGEFYLRAFNIERLPQDAYTPPTEADKAALKNTKTAEKAAAPKKAPCPLVNPTDDEAERLQSIWNERARQLFFNHNSYMKPEDFTPSTVCRITQAQYSANSGGTYSKAETSILCGDARELSAYIAAKPQTKFCKIRTTWGNGNTSNKADRVIILTDKPQTSLPAGVWEADPLTVETVNA